MALTLQGVYPAATTEFNTDGSLDLSSTANHINAMLDAGIHGLVMLGTVGENTSLLPEEKREVLTCAVETVNGRVPVMTGVAENSTDLACVFARDAVEIGVDALMVLPAMVYRQDGREVVEHFQSVGRAVDIPKMIYNNPVSYKVDITTDMLQEIANEPSYIAIKESSDDPRRITDIFNTCGDRYIVFCGVDDLALESFLLGAVGWISGLTNSFPTESVRLYELALAGEWKEALALYRWFTPVLHLDTHEKLVQYIKLSNQMTGLGSETVRAPRLMLTGDERKDIEKIIQTTIDTRP